MNKKFKGFVAYFVIFAMLVCSASVLAADEYADKMLSIDGEDSAELFSDDASLMAADTGVIIEKSSGFSKSDFINYSTVESVTGVGGKATDDESVLVETKSQDVYFNSGSLTIDKSKIYVYEINVMPAQNLSHVYVGTKSHAAMSAKVYMDELIPNCWNKIRYVYNPAAGVSYLYVNGNDMGMFDIPEAQIADVNEQSYGLRFIFVPTKVSTTYNLLSAYIDNIRLYTSDDTVRDYPAEITNTDYGTFCADNANGIIYVDGSKTVSALKSFFVKNNIAFAQVLKSDVVQSDSVLLQNGYSFVVTDTNNVSKVYTTASWKTNVAVAYGSAAKAGNKYTSGEFTVQAKCSSSDLLVIAQYDKMGHLLGVSKSDTVSKSRVVTSLDTVGYDGSVVKVFLWDSSATLKPKTVVSTYTYRSKDINALFIGSEHVFDSTAYIRSLANADGIDIGIGTLTADNADYADHLSSVSASDFCTFTYNGAKLGIKSFDSLALEQYTWDFVVLQNYIGSYDDMTDAAWNPVTSNLVAYIKAKLPEAKIIINTPVPNQIGYYYNDGDDIIEIDADVQNDVSSYFSEQASNAAGIASIDNNENIRFADTAALYSYIQGMAGYDAVYYEEGHSIAADNAVDGIYNAGNGIISDDDANTDKISLYRDGTHASAAGMYLQSLYMYSKLIGEGAANNTFVPTDSMIVDSDNSYAESGSIKYKLNPIASETAQSLKRIVAGFEVYGNNNVYLTPKTDGFSAKPADSVIVDEKFDEYNGSALGNGWMITKSSAATAEVADDADCGGKYFSMKKAAASNTISAKKFFASNGGNVRLDMQLMTNNIYGEATFKMFGYNYSEGSNMSSYLKLSGDKLFVVEPSNSSKPIIEMVPGQWYNISINYNADRYVYDIYVNGMLMYSNAVYHVSIRTFECFDIYVPSTGIADICLDNIRVSHALNGESPTNNDDISVVYYNDFDDTLGNQLVKSDTCGDIYYGKENENGYIWANRTNSDSGSCSTEFAFPTVKDNVTLEFDVYLEDNGGATKLISLQGGIAATIFFSGTNITILDADNKRPVVKKDVTIGQWHHVKIVTRIESSAFELYFDDVCLDEDAPFQSTGEPKLSSLRFAITSGGASAYRMDNVKITRNYDYTPRETEIDGYSPDEDAPTSYDWQSDYVSAPTGTVYEAESMKLTNYDVFADDSYNGGSGIAVDGSGYGVAEFTFGGSSGYYAINVGFGESEGVYDSFYELKQNNSRLDWWIGQYDDNVHHVRNARSYHYVKKGDKFKIIGKGGMDPSKLDYVEFETAGELPEYTYGDLIEDDGMHPSYWRTSSWDATEEGGYVRYGKTVYDCRTDANCELIRNVYPFYKPFVFDYTLQVSSSDNCYVKIGDGNTFPVSYKFSSRAITVGGSTLEKAFSTGALKYRIAVDTISKTFTLIVNGYAVAENVPFDGNVDKFTQIRFETSDEGTSKFVVSNVKLSAGYSMFETFRPYPDGRIPCGWEISYSSPVIDEETGEVSDSGQPLATGRTMKSEGADAQSLRITADGTAKKTFDKIKGKITYESYIILPVAKDGAAMQLGSGDDYIGFYTKDGNIYYDTNSGDDAVLWENYKSNVWYTLRIELDTETNLASFYVNDFKKAQNIDVKLDGVDNVNFVSGSNEGYLWVDDVSVVNSIYETTVPTPQVPELKDDYTIVMECCDLWREGNHFGNYSYSPFDNRIPFLGYLEDGNPEVADWETKFMAEHGITTYVPCWYINSGYSNSPIKDPRNSAKLHAFLKSDYSEYLDFAILVTTVSSNGGIDGFINNFVNFWIERYFKAPNYWKVGNRPVIPIYDVNAVSNIAGGDMKTLIGRFNEALVENGFDGGIFIGIHNQNITTSANGYSYKYRYHMGTAPIGTSVITSLLTQQSTDNVGYLASPSQGWGNEAWGRADRKYNIPIDQWYGSLEWIRDQYFPSQSSSSLTSNTLWLGNWNEYSEGHALAPSRLAGFAYLDGVRKVFTNGAVDHYDELPDKSYDQMTAIMWK